ncbi:hypothetical protein EH5_04286 [Bacillus subtilis]|nr:hypothetical protein EH5_04286 [Bacillus subtilis]
MFINGLSVKIMIAFIFIQLEVRSMFIIVMSAAQLHLTTVSHPLKFTAD